MTKKLIVLRKCFAAVSKLGWTPARVTLQSPTERSTKGALTKYNDNKSLIHKVQRQNTEVQRSFVVKGMHTLKNSDKRSETHVVLAAIPPGLGLA